MRDKVSVRRYLALVVVNFIYACTSIFTKMASKNEAFSVHYILLLSGAVAVLGVYAVLWQQIIKRMPVGDAYMFKGLSLVFVLLLAHFIFGEFITIYNIIGAAVIIGGIALNAKS